jgi:phosphoglycolate phosphatase
MSKSFKNYFRNEMGVISDDMKKTITIKAVIFDFDGVLADTWDTSISICKKVGLDFTVDDFKDHHNGNVYEKPVLEFKKQQVADFFTESIKRATAGNLFPLLKELEQIDQKYKMFIISSNSEISISKYFLLGKWTSFFEKIYGRETDNSKVKKFEILFQEYSLKPEECVFVTDTLGDLLEGAKVGVKTLAVTWGYHGEMRLRKGNPSKIIHNFNELSEAIETM